MRTQIRGIPTQIEGIRTQIEGMRTQIEGVEKPSLPQNYRGFT
jgi:hypothetical protein